jgi:hypothetical protein
MRLANFFVLASVLLGFCLRGSAESEPSAPASGPSFGPLYDGFRLTLDPGYRTEAVGPFFYDQQRDTEHTWAVPPLVSWTTDPAVELKEFDFLYPVMTYDRYGDQYRWQFFQLLSFAGGPSQQENVRSRFTLFPLYFQQRSSDPSQNYTAVVPFYGHFQNHLFRSEVFFVMLPCYVQSRRRDVVTDNYLWPFFSRRRGDGLTGWKAWPIAGHEHKVITTRTNNFGDVETVAGRDEVFAVWPIYFNNLSGIGTTNLTHDMGVLPFYSQERSAQRDSSTVIWPFFTHIVDRGKQYTEWDTPWPFIEFARGTGKTTSRVFPLFSRAHSDILEDNFYLWPIYKFDRIHAPPLDRQRTRIVFFLYSDTIEKSTENGMSKRMTSLLPLFTHRREFNGNTRLQVLAILEPFTPGSHKIERDWSPLWALWRAEKNPKTGAASQSLLWNLYRHDSTPEHKKVSVLFGLFQYQSGPSGKRVRVLYVPFGKANPAGSSSAP